MELQYSPLQGCCEDYVNKGESVPSTCQAEWLFINVSVTPSLCARQEDRALPQHQPLHPAAPPAPVPCCQTPPTALSSLPCYCTGGLVARGPAFVGHRREEGKDSAEHLPCVLSLLSTWSGCSPSPGIASFSSQSVTDYF